MLCYDRQRVCQDLDPEVSKITKQFFSCVQAGRWRKVMDPRHSGASCQQSHFSDTFLNHQSDNIDRAPPWVNNQPEATPTFVVFPASIILGASFVDPIEQFLPGDLWHY